MIINRLSNRIEHLKKVEFKTVNGEQRDALRKEYNTTISRLEYAQDGGCVVFISNKETYSKLQYYMALEYDAESLEYYIQFEDSYIFAYRDALMANKLFRLLESK